MIDERIRLQGDLVRACRKTRQAGNHLEWTGAGVAQKIRMVRWAPPKHGVKVYRYPSIEALRCIALGRQMNPRVLFYACEHNLLIAEVPQLRCGCGNKLCILPAHANVIGPPVVTVPPAISPKILQLMAGMSDDEILARLRGPFLEPLSEDAFNEAIADAFNEPLSEATSNEVIASS
jgi:hypothetical protein